MGWSKGTTVMDAIIEETEKLELSHSTKVEFYIHMIDRLMDLDWDCVDECCGYSPAFDDAYATIAKKYGWD